uniref:Short-chain dehydrogenase n=1 Tax=Chelonoidis abingdonii TaxID=106734 RepID=A0A8C0GF22_CHEAB
HYFPLRLDLLLITGAANGIGRQIALNFARLGATLVAFHLQKFCSHYSSSQTCVISVMRSHHLVLVSRA